jgi:glycosyltransferase involved in cell wall biosynthesis
VTATVSVVIPVKDGERYLEEVLEAVRREGVDEVLVIDSGSSDCSTDIVRSAGVELLEIAAEEFGHGRTRNLGAERTAGELICFLTQDATPVPGWLAAYRDAFSLAPGVGAAFGPHLPRPDTSPMIARELDEFFASFSAHGPVLQTAGNPTFLSNVNACYSRACWAELRFRDLDYAEDQAFGVDLLAAGGRKVYHPDAGVLHAHDYGIVEFMRRYFDEYRGLREATGYVHPFGVRAAAGYVRSSVAADRRWMRARGLTGGQRTRWTARAVAHYGGRYVFSTLGSRAERVPPRVQRALSLEQRGESAPTSAARHNGAIGEPAMAAPPPLPASVRTEPKRLVDDYEIPSVVWREGPAPLCAPVSGMADRARLRIAMIIPPFSRGSGGHNTLFQIFSRLERKGHVCSVWLHDYQRNPRELWPAQLRQDIIDFFAPISAPVFCGFDDWHGADVVVATGWQTVHPALRLDRCFARAYIVNDHEPDFYAVSTEQRLAGDTYRHGLHCIAASPWLRDSLIAEYGASADAFELGVDHATYLPRPTQRRRDTVIYYARHETPRRAVPVGLLALSELHRRRPDVRIVLFGTLDAVATTFPYEHLGILTPAQLSWLYSESTVGLCLSLTNFSLMPKEMIACGLPCVELAGVSAESIFGEDGPIELTPLDPAAIADALERLLDDRSRWERRSRDGIALVASHTWERATDEVEAGLRHALRMRETAALVGG